MNKKYLIVIGILIIIFSTTSILIKAEDALASNENTYFNLEEMEKALERYEKLAYYGGWSPIPAENNLKKEDEGELIVLLRKRLHLTGDLLFMKSLSSNIFDSELEEAVKKFQVRHGLPATGVVDKKTLKELNISVETRISQIQKNINQMKKYIDKLPENYIMVNIPDFKLNVVENKKTVMTMKTIVGSKYSPTPVFDRKITYLVLNPTWVIPYKSSVVVILPKIHKDPDYLKKNNIKVFRGWGDSSVEVNANSIEWSKVDKSNLSYRFVQEPGPFNPMGLVKFKFPNKYNVYLHGTPKQYLFNKRIRIFSAGCIRIEEPIKLAKYILQDKPGWSSAEINRILENGKNQTVHLSEPLPVFIVYWTVWATEDGQVHFRDNIYNR